MIPSSTRVASEYLRRAQDESYWDVPESMKMLPLVQSGVLSNVPDVEGNIAYDNGPVHEVAREPLKIVPIDIGPVPEK